MSDVKNETPDNSWLMLLCLLGYMNEHGVDFSNDYSNDYDYIQNCPSVEWEQDMGKSIPFCGLDGDMCDMQCRMKA